MMRATTTPRTIKMISSVLLIPAVDEPTEPAPEAVVTSPLEAVAVGVPV